MFAIIQRLIYQEAKPVISAADPTPRASVHDLGLTSFDAIRLLVAIEWTFRWNFCEMLKRDRLDRSDRKDAAGRAADAGADTRKAA